MNAKVVLITGASSGIGKACAEAFAAEGAILALTGRNFKALEETKTKCCTIGVKPDNVGILVLGSIETTSMEEYDRQMNINVRSPFLMTKLCLPHLLKTKGNIVNISSVGGLRAFPGKVAYNLSKAALDQLTRTAALEVASRGVRVNTVNPGVIPTEMHRRGGMDEETYRKHLERGKLTHAMGRVGEAHEVASAVVFLASEKASFITGTTFPVDGGKHNMCP